MTVTAKMTVMRALIFKMVITAPTLMLIQTLISKTGIAALTLTLTQAFFMLQASAAEPRRRVNRTAVSLRAPRQ